MTSYTVKDTSGLLSTLRNVKSGDTVYLQSGTYSSVNLNGFKIDGNVTITSLSPDRPAVLSDLNVNNSKGLTFKSMEFDASIRNSDLPFRIANSENIKLDSLYVHGSLNDKAADDVRGLIVRSSINIEVVNSKFEQLTDALTYLDNNGAKFSGNSFNNLRDNGIAGGGTSNLTISDNFFTNFDHTGEIHADAIQVWTTNTTKSAQNINISNNVFDRGSGSIVQGIWMRDEVGNLPFKNVSITGNTIVGAQYHGIAINHAEGVNISGNTVIARDDQQSWIRVNNSTDAVVSNNIASDFLYVDSVVTKDSNVLAGTISTKDALNLSSFISTKKQIDIHDNHFSKELLGKVQLMGYLDDPLVNGVFTKHYDFKPSIINGTSGSDNLRAKLVGSYILDAGAGNDTLTGGAKGRTNMLGGAGNDTYVVKGKNDVVIELDSQGTDTVVTHINYTLSANVENVRLAAVGLSVFGNDLNNSMVGTAGSDYLYGEGGNDALQGGAGDDALYGGLGADNLKGEDGNDLISGGDGNDSLYGGAGNDILNGGSGNNLFEGGAGSDKLSGGSGQDTFLFRASDFVAGVDRSVDDIFNFNSGHGDKIHLAMLDANVNSSNKESFRFISSESFHGVAGELRYEVVKGDSYVFGDLNGDRTPDFKIHIVGVTMLSASDFIL
jgi:Ca2+-binding RTX toxin-like protein